MQKIVIIIILFIGVSVQGQKGDVTLFFKNGEVFSGSGKLKGAHFIKFTPASGGGSKTIHFEELTKAEMMDSEGEKITYALWPIVKKNKKPKEPSVIGELVSGKVYLYVKGVIHKNEGSIMFPTDPVVGAQVITAGGPSHFFIRKEGDKEVIHLGSSQRTIKGLLSKLHDVFDECPEVYNRITEGNLHFDTIMKAVEFYNGSCK